MKTKAIAWQIHIQKEDGKWIPVCAEFGFAIPNRLIEEIGSLLSKWYDINPNYMFKNGEKK